MGSTKALRRVTAALAVGTAMTVAQPVMADTITTTGTSLIDYWNSIKSNWWTMAGTIVTGSWSNTGTTTYGPGITNTVISAYSWMLSISSTVAEGLETQIDTSLLNVNGTFYGPEVGDPKTSAVVSASLAVPGPVAAAGLPGVLALLGYAAWRRRKTLAA